MKREAAERGRLSRLKMRFIALLEKGTPPPRGKEGEEEDPSGPPGPCLNRHSRRH
jgi:hypothetical protein